MSWRSISFSLAFLAGCAGSGADRLPEYGEILKISYYRVNVDPRTRKAEPTYRVVMSKSWQDRIGDSPREPFTKAAPRRVYMGYVGDAQMRSYFASLERAKVNQLRPSDPKSYNPLELHARALDRREYDALSQPLTRIVTIGTDKWERSYYYRDQQADPELIARFVSCEKLVSQMVQWSLLIETGTQPFFGQDR